MVALALLQCGIYSTLQRFRNLALCWTLNPRAQRTESMHCILLPLLLLSVSGYFHLCHHGCRQRDKCFEHVPELCLKSIKL